MRLKGPCGSCGNPYSFNFSRVNQQGKCFSCGLESKDLKGIVRVWKGEIFAFGLNGPLFPLARKAGNWKRFKFLG